ncbi:MAG: hypothetical protein KIT70_04200 [Anaerolineales bacterium]|nr:MAG: hypothetical protein KIT70_04200 [Anaerolineales bacterium]
MEMSNILSRAWKIVWKHKVLWIFGILASCGSRSGGGSGGGGNSFSTDSGQNFNPPAELERFFTNIERSMRSVSEEQIAIFVAIFIAAICLLVIITWLVGLYGKTGVTVGALQAEAGRAVTFRSIWGESWGVFDRVVGLNFLLALPPILLGLVVVFGFVAVGALTMGIGALCLLPLLCLFIPIGIAYGIFTDFASIAVVKDGLSISAAIQRGWDVLSKNVGSLALLALILILGSFFISIILALPFFVALLPLLLGAASGDVMQNMTFTLVCFAAAIPVIMVASGILYSYLQTAWTLAYSELTAAK